jgi:hypothetical protein
VIFALVLVELGRFLAATWAFGLVEYLRFILVIGAMTGSIRNVLRSMENEVLSNCRQFLVEYESFSEFVTCSIVSVVE